MLRASRAALAQLMTGISTVRPPAIRRASEDDWLLATDLSELVHPEETASFVRAAEEQGWRVGRAANGWLLLDRIDLLPRLEASSPEGTACAGEIGALISLLERHLSASNDMDARALRALAKASEQGSRALTRVCAGLHLDWAEKLRRHEKIPGALLPYLRAAGSETRGIDTLL